MALQLDTRKTTLLDFALRNDQDLNVLYILGTPGGQNLTLELTNVAGEPLDLLPPAPASPKPYHFELVFRPGVLSEDTRSGIALQESGVTMSQVKNADGTVALRLTVTKPTLAPGEKLTCTLLRVAPDGRLGSRGTRVLLRYANVQVHGAGTLIGGFRETHLNIVTHVGKATMPLHVGVVGAGKVLNNGQPNLPLKLRVSNTSLSDDIRPGTQPPSNFYLSFDIGGEKDEWALGTAALVDAIEVLLNGSAVGVEKLPGKTPEWQIRMPALPRGAYFDLTLNKIATRHPAGLTNVHLRYDNIPGYWDGQFVTQLEKSPLVFVETNVAGGTNVGIGTAKPAQKLEVAGVVYTNGESTGFVADAGGLSRVGLLKYAGREAGIWRTKAQDFEIGRVDVDALPGTPSTWITDLYVSGAGNVGVGTDNPRGKFDVRGGGDIYLVNDASNSNGQSVYLPGHLMLAPYSADNGNAYIQARVPNPTPTTNIGIVLRATRQGQFFDAMVLTPAGNVGIGTGSPRGKFDVRGSGDIYLVNDASNSNGQSVYLPGHLMLAPYSADNGNAYIQARVPNPTPTTNIGIVLRATRQGQFFDAMVLTPAGNVGIGTGSPQYPLHVTRATDFRGGTYGYLSRDGGGRNTDANTFKVSIYSDGRMVAPEFDALSDARLKTVIGLSDHAADLALLRRLRITDYTMRDRVQFGNQAYKKIIGQELEEVFPQAVRQHTGFLPDIYASASQVQHRGEVLLLTLPAGLPQAAPAGQRLKLIGPAGEVLATLAEAAAAGTRQLLVSGAESLADAPAQEVFVFGLEHPDVRTVDYEALAMLNVSATQALAQQVQELQALTQTLPELRRRLESQDAKVAQYEQLVPALAEALKQQQQQLEELRTQVLCLAAG